MLKNLFLFLIEKRYYCKMHQVVMILNLERLAEQMDSFTRGFTQRGFVIDDSFLYVNKNGLYFTVIVN